jgi:isopenicillin-N epimerase
LVISHGANSPRQDRTRYQIEFDWTGTRDPSPWLTVPAALTEMGALLPGGWPAIRRQNRRLALAAQHFLAEGLGIGPPCPASMVGSMAAVPLAPARDASPPKSPLYEDPLQDWLLQEHQIEVPIIPWPQPPQRVLRVSAQLYNSSKQYQLLANALSAGPGRSLVRISHRP